eukprot:GFUD01036121.1.p1 GENE.GFUD01036121.1~~GFUD01036121.1.p1  ORF type:complete len:233 (+),score=70.61 GFUD01036121.1:43-741(+)
MEEWKVVQVEKKGDLFNVPEDFEMVVMDQSNFSQYFSKVQHLIKPDMVWLGMEGGTFKFVRKIGTSGNDDGDDEGNGKWQWKAMDDENVPTNALAVGKDQSETFNVFVGRGEVDGKFHLGKVHNGECYVVYEGEEHKINAGKFEVLCVADSDDDDYYKMVEWVDCEDGVVPSNAVRCSKDGQGQYVGRGQTENQITPGKIVPQDGCMYAPYGGRIHKLTKYEALVIYYYSTK